MRLKDEKLTHRDVAKLRRVMAQVKDKRTYVRMQAVILLGCGYSIQQVADLMNSSRQAVYNWLSLYLKQRDPAALLEHQRSGRPQSAAALSAQRILKTLQLDPRALGFRHNAWTVAILAQYLNGHYHTCITAATLRRRLKAMGLRYKRPKYVYEEKEPHQAQKKGL